MIEVIVLTFCEMLEALTLSPVRLFMVVMTLLTLEEVMREPPAATIPAAKEVL